MLYAIGSVCKALSVTSQHWPQNIGGRRMHSAAPIWKKSQRAERRINPILSFWIPWEPYAYPSGTSENFE